jgi:hypothetical protein
MEEEENKSQEKKKRPGGRKPLAEQDKAMYNIGSFRVNIDEKLAWEKLFEESGMKKQTDFFRKFIIRDSSKLYLSNTNLNLIYKKLVEIQSDIKAIGNNYHHAVRRIKRGESDKDLHVSLNELTKLQEQTKAKLEEVIEVYREISPFESKNHK